MKNKILFVILTMCLFVGCVTPYGKSGMRGGYSDQRLGEDVIRVHFKGNGYTTHEKVTTYLFYRCAEVTLKNGYDYFEILDKNSDKETFISDTDVLEHAFRFFRIIPTHLVNISFSSSILLFSYVK